MDKFQAFQKKYLPNLYPARGITLVRGEGVYLFDAEGRRYLDFFSQYGVMILGYDHPRLTATIARQAAELPALHGSFACEVRALASRALAERCGLDRVWWCNSGAEAIEAALKFACLASGQRRFIAFEGAYHGRTLGALSATWGPAYRAPFEPLAWEVVHLPFGDEQALAAALAQTAAAAVLIEPIQGEGGLRAAPPGFLATARRLCTEAGCLLILDEVQTGCGRTGRFLAAEHEGVKADIVCLGKGLAGGLPVGAALMAEAVAQAIPRGVHGSTFGGNPLVCAAALTVLDLLDDDMLRHITDVGVYLRDRLAGINHPRIGGVRGQGLMAGIAVTDGRDALLKSLQVHGILAIPAGADVVRFLPPYPVTGQDVDVLLSALDTVLQL